MRNVFHFVFNFQDVLISNEVVERPKLIRVATLSKYAIISLCVDNLQVIQGVHTLHLPQRALPYNCSTTDQTVPLLKELGEIARSVNAQINVLVEVNVGHDRCGIDPKYFISIES
jgi:D-serine deaminase-like pyridoxal phosphate-dependent protein